MRFFGWNLSPAIDRIGERDVGHSGYVDSRMKKTHRYNRIEYATRARYRKRVARTYKFPDGHRSCVFLDGDCIVRFHCSANDRYLCYQR